MKNKNLIEETSDFFGVLYPFVSDDDITDIDYNGSALWLTYSDNSRELEEIGISDDFVEQFSARVSNAVSKPFNKQYPVLEAETDFLRITIVHESIAMSGRTFCIRKSLPSVRLTEQSMISTGFCSREALEFLKECIKNKKNIVFCGEPGAGKTECAKFFSKYIDKEDRVITIEDNAEWHYSLINEGKDCIELKVNDVVDYSKAIMKLFILWSASLLALEELQPYIQMMLGRFQIECLTWQGVFLVAIWKTIYIHLLTLVFL